MIVCFATIHPVAESNECSDWDTNGYFRSATVQDVAECIRSGVDLNVRGNRDRTPLHVAAMLNEHPLVVTALVAAGADVRMRDLRDHTPLHSAAMANDSPAVVEALVNAGADPNAPSLPASMDDLIIPAGQRTYSFYGFELWGTPWFFHNLESGRDNPSVDRGAMRGESPLIAGALVGGENPTVFALLAELATLTDPSFRNADAEGPPAIALLEENLGAMNELLEMLKARKVQGLRPIHVAARFSGSATVVAALAEAGADVHAVTVHDYNALHVAGGHGRSPAVVAALVDTGVNIKAHDSTGGSPLHVAASSSDTPQVVKALIDAGADMEARDHQDRTPLHRAYDRFYRSPEVINVLLAAGADARALDSEGKTPKELGQW